MVGGEACLESARRNSRPGGIQLAGQLARQGGIAERSGAADKAAPGLMPDMEELTKKLLHARENGSPNTVVVDLNRAKAVFAMLISFGAVLLGISNTLTAMMSAPRQVEEVRHELTLLRTSDTEADKRLALLEQNINFIKETLQDIRSDMKNPEVRR